MRAAAALLLMAGPGLAQPMAPGEEAAMCAALWHGTADARYHSARMMPEEARMRHLANGFEALAIAAGAEPEAVEADIRRDRPGFERMAVAYVLAQDAETMRLYQRLMQRCEAIAAADPATDELQRITP